jgi:hypothetical protein
MGENNSNWGISKSITVSSLIAITLQTVALVWYISTLDAAVSTNAREIARQEIRLNEIERTSQAQAVMLARIDENILSIRASIESVLKKIGE